MDKLYYAVVNNDYTLFVLNLNKIDDPYINVDKYRRIISYCRMHDRIKYLVKLLEYCYDYGSIFTYCYGYYMSNIYYKYKFYDLTWHERLRKLIFKHWLRYDACLTTLNEFIDEDIKHNNKSTRGHLINIEDFTQYGVFEIIRELWLDSYVHYSVNEDCHEFIIDILDKYLTLDLQIEDHEKIYDFRHNIRSLMDSDSQ